MSRSVSGSSLEAAKKDIEFTYPEGAERDKVLDCAGTAMDIAELFDPGSEANWSESGLRQKLRLASAKIDFLKGRQSHI